MSLPSSARPGSLGAWAALFVAGLGACGGPDARPPNPTRPLDERTAIEVMRQGIADEGESPGPHRDVPVADGKLLRLDVTVAGKKIGIAYLTSNDRTSLGGAVPARKAGDDSLQVLPGSGDEQGARYLILRDVDYLQDDHVGTDHESTTITAEKKLQRDVRDFVVLARTQKWE
ncbi:MAG: hypothetical protein IT376_17265 [Polyangiaceae bacterium]|nr:hypothetical protein [Polyangiaceae bacterium]